MIDRGRIPRHIAFIMDGNGRWAKERGLPRSVGHREGIKTVRQIIATALDLGIEVVTLFAFSNENWARPRNEVHTIMRYLTNFLDRETGLLHKKKVRLKVIGREKPLPKSVLDRIKKAQYLTRMNDKMTIVLALNYGSRQEIVDAAKEISAAVVKGEMNADELDEAGFSRFLYTAGIPDPDLLIRTSGEMRVSNFLLWQLSYAEFYFPQVYWPDFSKEHFLRAIEDYQARERRFGGVNVG